ncbi:MAG: YggT family protein [Anaerolineae bacterium]
MIGFIIYQILRVYMFILIARAIISFLPMFNVQVSRDNPVVDAIYQMTEPPIAMIRQYVPPAGGMDLGFLILYIILIILQRLALGLPF